MNPETIARLLIRCDDKPGIVAAATTFLYHHGANITELDQHSTSPADGQLFMRLEFQTPALDLPRAGLERAFADTVAAQHRMNWRMSYAADKPRMAILVSAHDHAAMELLWRWQRGELRVDIPCVISNHEALRKAVEGFGVPFHHVPFETATRADAEDQMQKILVEAKADFIVLARYMRILSGDFAALWPSRIINIHHSFLPAFVGADPYRQAYERGVKIIGATAHYVTADLDQGPIIEQDVARVSHSEGVDELRRLGRDLERQVLARAVRWHVEDRIIVDGNKTVVFN
ncbi:formyltetrahydrofolate deformylase [Nevskia sp.]|uniref:formyltetrahydrofolate deformylase n=1 Tax=Nevskia sp. TaxID=1929292 RepID=UPI0025F6AE51|nr:formyltetrahydrofolate deformylase [Nevskia sp.]